MRRYKREVNTPEWFIAKRIGTRTLFNIDLIPRHYPTVGGILVALKGNLNGYDTTYEALDAAKIFKNKMREMVEKNNS